MNTNKLKNIFLGIIAINLTLITLIQLEIFPPKVYASEIKQPINTNYGLVPVNEDGSINVTLMETSAVYIKGWIYGTTYRKLDTVTGIPVNTVEYNK